MLKRSRGGGVVGVRVGVTRCRLRSDRRRVGPAAIWGYEGGRIAFEDLFAPMFDFAWSEIAMIAAVALVVIGPKDLPVALRAISGFIKKARRMAGEFQTHVDEMMRDADLKDVKDSLNRSATSIPRHRREGDRPRPHACATRSHRSIGYLTATVAPAPAANSPPASRRPTKTRPSPEPLPPPERVAAPPFVPPALVPFMNGGTARTAAAVRPPASVPRPSARLSLPAPAVLQRPPD